MTKSMMQNLDMASSSSSEEKQQIEPKRKLSTFKLKENV